MPRTTPPRAQETSMGDIDAGDPRETPQSAWGSLLGFADRYADLGYRSLAEQLRAGGPPPPSVQGTPIIVDSDIGGDPDDAIAVTCAARNLPEVALILTADEYRGRRARFARHLLDLMERPDLPVVSGADLGNTRYHAIDGLIPDTVAEQPTDIVAAVRAVCAGTEGPVRWVGMGPLSNLAHVLRSAPELNARLVVTQMGGAIDYRHPDRAEHNFRLDPDAARYVVATARELLLVLSDTTFTDEIAIGPGTDIYRALAADAAPAWAAVLRAHLDQWFARFYPASLQHDPLTLSAALQLPFIDFTRRRISLGPDARMTVAGDDSEGHPTWITTGADYPAFRAWLSKQIHY
ncbi:nucleoside hydrolase [Nocardia terpenica]|uniref:Nucleoside hydrolase n=2 Tax=Nocardia terpenica TaxID=455432 RepID=A0A291RHA9_9NOCA|nr:nucleoside hydrolase [Nocardia terpenica]